MKEEPLIASSCGHAMENGLVDRSGYDVPQEWLGSPDRIRATLEDLESGPATASSSEVYPPHGLVQFRPPPLDYRRTRVAHSRFQVLQRWVGFVLDVGEEEFTARLHDLTTPSPDEETSILIDDLSADDRDLLRSGAIFYLNIGYHTEVSGQRIRGMIVRFKRFPKWTADEILDARQRGEERIKKLVGE